MLKSPPKWGFLFIFYDLEKFKNGPISVEIIDKKPEPVKKKRK